MVNGGQAGREALQSTFSMNASSSLIFINLIIGVCRGEHQNKADLIRISAVLFMLFIPILIILIIRAGSNGLQDRMNAKLVLLLLGTGSCVALDIIRYGRRACAPCTHHRMGRVSL